MDQPSHPPAQFGYAPPPPPPGPQWNGKTNGFSIAALAMSLIGCAGIFTIVFGIVGLNQSRRNGDKRGKVFAIIALSITGLWLLVFAVAIGVAVVRDVADGPDRDAAGVIRGERSISLSDLRAGDCAKDLEEQTGTSIDVLPCSSPHSSEVVAIFDLPSTGVTDPEAAAEAGCEKAYQTYTGQKVPEDAKFFLFTARMAELGTTNDPTVLCFAHQLTGTTTGSLKR
ncbi:hypothetical protein FHR83_009015 [Actinoplanes campanulatus]|uniref:Septum formation n=1 Tax=Actinoplanes campanulatus TaxID=113559 RepID=A0A7W5AS88_9ACTN|nr:DUF4190 domain-containing protein [Actinoplanes campanulatus]MBB3101287.1 hypothetical protein [Actinoplanes campanulatus]GGN50739.1 hypothetical protein GCM10010109_90230 [Actinoplanes campanulatus]GID42170.1 hypothetical protein Aca09nite_86760 [Actinoplanes campanulatus]